MGESNRQKCRRINDEVETLIAAIAKREGMTLKRERGSFTKGGSVTVKFTFEDEADLAEKSEWTKADARMLGLPEDVVGRTFHYNGHEYEVTGINMNRPKYPIDVARLPDRRAMKFTDKVLIIVFGEEEASHASA